MTTTTPTANYFDIVSQLPPATDITFHNVSWEDYEELLDQVGEASGLRISYNEGTLQVMSLSPEHENYAEFIKRLVDVVSLRLRINIRFFGSATMRKSKKRKGKEPDACFYVQTAAALGNKIQLDFETDPPPDIVVEVDVHHTSRDMFSIYAGLGVSEIWHYDGLALTIYQLQDGVYAEVAAGPALPMLTGQILTGFLDRMRTEGEFQTLLAFDEWLQSTQK
ncbi:MAG: Uma2 family endonuclease [Blastocatellales bacterium]